VTARAVSERSDLPSSSCPLRVICSVLDAPASGPAAFGSTPHPRGSARRRRSSGGATRAGARPHTRRSSLPPRRTDRTTRQPACTHDNDRIDRPRAAPARSSWTRAATRRTLPRGSASPRARREGPGGQDPGLHLLHVSRYAIPALPTSTASDAPPARFALPTGRPQAATASQSPPRAPPRSTCIRSATRASCSAVTTTMSTSSRRDSGERVRHRRRRHQCPR